MAIDHIVGADIVNQQVVDSGLSSLAPGDVVGAAHVVYKLQFEALQREQSCRSRERAVGDRPQDIRVDDAPEQVFPPTPASSPNTIVGSHLVEPIHSSHVVASDTDRHRQVDDLSVATCCSHCVIAGVIGGNHANVTLVTPIAKHDTFRVGPIGRFTLLQDDHSKCSREVSPRPLCCDKHVGISFQQVNNQLDRSETNCPPTGDGIFAGTVASASSLLDSPSRCSAQHRQTYPCIRWSRGSSRSGSGIHTTASSPTLPFFSAYTASRTTCHRSESSPRRWRGFVLEQGSP